MSTRNGNSAAPYIIYYIFRDGVGGVLKNNEEANKWLKLSAEMGDAASQRQVGSRYAFGSDGFIKNYVLAYMWKNIAMANGKSNENVMLNLLERRFMTREQIAEAQRLAQEWMEKH